MANKWTRIGLVFGGGLIIAGLVVGGVQLQQRNQQEKAQTAAKKVHKRQQQAQHSRQKVQSAKKAAANKAKQAQLVAEVQPTVVNDQKLDDYVTQTGFVGTALVVRDKKILLSKGYGLANRAKQIKNTPNTLYPIASTEKSLIATGILQLQEQGKLHVSDPIATYLPKFPNGQKIKLTDLLHHTSGIVGRNQDNQTKSSDQLLQEIIANGIKQQPGKWRYLDANYIVLMKVLEKVSHQNYQTYLQEHIMQPSQMAHSGFMTTQFAKLANASVGYAPGSEGQLPNFSQLAGVGDMYMTATDMYRFDQALWSNRLINANSRAAMFQPGSRSQYGMGFYNDPALIVNRGYLSGWSVSNGFSHHGRLSIILFSNVKNDAISLSKMNGDLYTKAMAN